MKTNNEMMWEMAQEYVALGWRIGVAWGINEDDGTCTCEKPRCGDEGKHPVTTRGVKDATKDLEKIRRWLFEDPPKLDNPRRINRNIFLATGAESGVTVLDVDVGDGKVGLETWVDLIQEKGEPETLGAMTGSGGLHVLFQYNSALKTSSNTLGKHVDCRNDNGYIIIAPSLHRSGKRYEWNNWGTPLAHLPAHLTQKKETRGRPKKDDLYRGKYTLEQVDGMLAVVPADDRDLWRAVGIALGREFNCSEAAWNVYNTWAEKDTRPKGRGHDANMKHCFYELSQQEAECELTLGTIIKAAVDNGWSPKKGEGSVETFVYDHESNGYIYRQSGAIWVAASVNAACGKVNDGGRLVDASEWIQTHARITTTTSTPAIKGDILKGYDCREGVLFKSPGGAVFNRYRPPTIDPGEASEAGPFEAHVRRLMPRTGDADQFFDYMAHRVQKPWEKPRFALMLAGDQGVGKDTAIDFCCPALGRWNTASIPPGAVEKDFNEYAAKTLIRINEAADLREMSRWAFNERIKVLIAGNPDECEINPKYGRKYTVTMHCGVIITTNHLTGSVHIPADDRRYDVIQCATLEAMGLGGEQERRDYFNALHEWFLKKEGERHVAAFLRARELSGFSAALGQRKTAAHDEIVKHGMLGDEWAVDALEALRRRYKVPDDKPLSFVSGSALLGECAEEKGVLRGKLPHAMRRLGYVAYPNPNRKDERWKVLGELHTMYRLPGFEPEAGWEKEPILF